MTNWPGFAAFATSGASTLYNLVIGVRGRFSRIFARALELRMLGLDFQPLPALLDFEFDHPEPFGVFRSQHVFRLAHLSEPVRNSAAPADGIGIIGDNRMPLFNFIEREEAAV